MDAEFDGLYEEVTLMHCFCYTIYQENQKIGSGTILTANELEDLFKELEEKEIILIGHNIIVYDLPVIKKLFKIEFGGRCWDTLAMSYKLYPDRPKHGLEYYGNRYKVPKPKVDDWKGSDKELYIYRCKKDVSINSILFGDLLSYFKDIYHPGAPYKDLDYITWKMDCAQEMERNPIKVDIDLVKKTKEEVDELFEEKKKNIEEHMPKVYKYKTLKRPEKLFKKDRTLSERGKKWLRATRDKGVSKDIKEIEVIDKVEEPNAGSVLQIKDFLFSFGWEPVIYETRKNKDDIEKEVPQIQDKMTKELCPDIERLAEEHDELKDLKGLYMLRHRSGVFKAFLEKADDNNMIYCSVNGFTNTMRFKHKKPIANMPGVKKPYGKQIRGALMARDSDHLFCGSDMSSLEDSTKQHYMYFFDPDYVQQMRIPGFDPHTDIAVFANLMTKEEEETFKKLKKKASNFDKTGVDPLSKEEKEIFDYLSGLRSNAKTVNFAGVYGAGPLKISKTLNCSLDFAKKLHKAYWERNNSVKQVANNCFFKKVRGQFWLWNPVAKMYYYLKAKKDIFSTLNQGTGVYCFDLWVMKVRRSGIVVQLQYHDELGFDFFKQKKEMIYEKLENAIDQVNDELKLNVPLGISVDIGQNYSEAH